MPLTDPNGNAIPDDDSRIPSQALIDKMEAEADEAVAFARSLPTGAPLGLLETTARVEALASLFVPPGSALERLYAYRTQENRAKNARMVVEVYQAAKAEAEKPRLVVPSVDVPSDLRG